MNKKSSFVFILLLFSFGMFAQKKTEFYIEPGFGLAIGQIDETIYASSGWQCSLLEWKQNPLINLNVNSGININKFNLNLFFNYSLPIKSGIFEDSDWNYDGMKYCYSRHKEKSVLNFSTALDVKYFFDFNQIFSFYPLVKASLYYDSFEARNGEGWYGMSRYSSSGVDVPWNDSNARYFKRLYGIDFSSLSFYFFAGIGFVVNLSENLFFCSDFSVSPYVYCHSIDHHLGADDGYSIREIQQDFFKRVYINLKCSYAINERIQISFLCSYLGGAEIKGDACIYSGYAENYFESCGQEFGNICSRFDISFVTKFLLKK